jgi:RNA polymerase sigma factor (sigma-70 family)
MEKASMVGSEPLDIILDRYGNMVLRLAFSCLKNRADAEDVLQDVFLKLIEKQPAFESEDHRRHWIVRVTINLCRNRLRSPWRRHQELTEMNLPADDGSWQDGSEVLEAVMALPAKYREVIHLFYYEDYSIAQISALLKKKEATIRSLLFRGRGMLRETLKGAVELEEDL